jgi:ABC-2 type transport system permease protein
MTALVGGALLAIVGLLTFVLPQFQQEIGEVLEQLPFVRMFLGALLGTELGEHFTGSSIQALFWVHPVVLAVVWAHAVMFCTRLPAGEIDRGTIDVLLGLPISRRTAYYAEVLAWLATGATVLALGYLGHRLALPTTPQELRAPTARVLIVVVNLYCVYLAVGGIAFLISSLSNRRGRAMAAAFAIVVASFLLNFVAQIWPPAQQLAPLGILEYYRPVEILQSGAFPATNLAVLLAVAALTVAAGGEVMARRSICTV